MKKILWVEDDTFLYIKWTSIISRLKPQIHIEPVNYARDAAVLIDTAKYDLLVVDLRINWDPGVSNEDNFFGLNILELAIRGSTLLPNGEKVSSRNVIAPESVWVLTGYAERRNDAIELGVPPTHYVVKGTERKIKFIERIIEHLS